MAQKIIPLGNRIIVRPIDEQSNQLFNLPDSIKEKPQKGTVLEVGPGIKGEPMIAKIGDTVFYKRGHGISIPEGYYPGETGILLLMKEGEDTLVVLSEIEDIATI